MLSAGCEERRLVKTTGALLFSMAAAGILLVILVDLPMEALLEWSSSRLGDINFTN